MISRKTRRIAAVGVAALYCVATAVDGGPGGLLIAAILVGCPLIFIWYSRELGEALSGEQPKLRWRWAAEVTIELAAWAVLGTLVVGFASRALG